MHSFDVRSDRRSGLVCLILIALIGIYLINGICYLNAQSITSDEAPYFNYAVRYLKGHPDRINASTDDSKMPVIVLNVIPRAARQIFRPGLKKADWGYGDILGGRYVTLLFSVLAILLVFQWSRQLYGNVAGLFAACLLSVSPNN